jgi:mRNA interferase MazF
MLQNYFLALLDWWKINVLLRGSTSTRLFKEAEIWWCSIGINVGVEIFGKGPDFARPVIIFKKFNTYSFLGIPLTTQLKEGAWYIPISFSGKERRAILSQIRVLDTRRLLRKMGTLAGEDFQNIQNRFIEFYSP